MWPVDRDSVFDHKTKVAAATEQLRARLAELLP